GELKLSWRRDRINLDGHAIEVQLSRPAARISLRVIGDDGAELGNGAAEFHREPPSTWLRVGWTQRPGSVLHLELDAEDVDGLKAHAELTPWEVRIAHEDVVFDTGKWDIRPSEAVKLDASAARIGDVLARVRRADPRLAVKLFIAGHT